MPFRISLSQPAAEVRQGLISCAPIAHDQLPAVNEGGRRRSLPMPSDLSRSLTRCTQVAKGPACKAECRGCESRHRVQFPATKKLFIATDSRCPSGRVGLQIRPGGCKSFRACQHLRRLSRSSDGGWLKPTGARSKTASLHPFL